MRNHLLAASSLVVAIASITSPTCVRADVIYSTFGPGDSYYTRGGRTLSRSLSPDGWRADAAMGFTITGGDYLLTSFQAAIRAFSGQSLTFDLMAADGADGRPGTILESITVAAASGIVTGTASGSVRLREGTTYFLGTDSVPGGFEGFWHLSEPAVAGLASSTYNASSTWGVPIVSPVQSAFRINGTLVPSAVPEPTGLALGATALAGLGAIGLGRSRACLARPAAR